MELIVTKKLTRMYKGGVKALDDLSFTIAEGEWVAMMGPSGSGKTTLLNILGCLDKPTLGSVLMEGVDLARFDRNELTRFRKEKVGLIFQQFHLIPYLTALENIMLAQYYHSMADETEAEEALSKVGLTERMSHFPSQLSGGEQQRVCIARALINQPKLILADEPTGNLDESNEEVILKLFRDLHQMGHTIVMVTHNPDIGKLADRRLELHHGKLTEPILVTNLEEQFDEVLESIWVLREEGKLSPARYRKLAGGKSPEILKAMASRRLIRLEGEEIRFRGRGEDRAKDLVRRHRLAEKLFSTILHIGEKQTESSACKFEHILTPEVADSICTFLKHPQQCSHGRPIPPGNCCRRGG